MTLIYRELSNGSYELSYEQADGITKSLPGIATKTIQPDGSTLLTYTTPNTKINIHKITHGPDGQLLKDQPVYVEYNQPWHSDGYIEVQEAKALGLETPTSVENINGGYARIYVKDAYFINSNESLYGNHTLESRVNKDSYVSWYQNNNSDGSRITHYHSNQYGVNIRTTTHAPGGEPIENQEFELTGSGKLLTEDAKDLGIEIPPSLSKTEYIEGKYSNGKYYLSGTNEQGNTINWNINEHYEQIQWGTEIDENGTYEYYHYNDVTIYKQTHTADGQLLENPQVIVRGEGPIPIEQVQEMGIEVPSSITNSTDETHINYVEVENSSIRYDTESGNTYNYYRISGYNEKGDKISWGTEISENGTYKHYSHNDVTIYKQTHTADGQLLENPQVIVRGEGPIPIEQVQEMGIEVPSSITNSTDETHINYVEVENSSIRYDTESGNTYNYYRISGYNERDDKISWGTEISENGTYEHYSHNNVTIYKQTHTADGQLLENPQVIVTGDGPIPIEQVQEMGIEVPSSITNSTDETHINYVEVESSPTRYDTESGKTYNYYRISGYNERDDKISWGTEISENGTYEHYSHNDVTIYKQTHTADGQLLEDPQIEIHGNGTISVAELEEQGVNIPTNYNQETISFIDGQPQEVVLDINNQTATEIATPPSVGEDTPAVGEGAPPVGEDTPAIGEGAPPVGEDIPAVGEATPPVGEDTPAIGEATPPVGEDTNPNYIPVQTSNTSNPITGYTSPQQLAMEAVATALDIPEAAVAPMTAGVGIAARKLLKFSNETANQRYNGYTKLQSSLNKLIETNNDEEQANALKGILIANQNINGGLRTISTAHDGIWGSGFNSTFNMALTEVLKGKKPEERVEIAEKIQSALKKDAQQTGKESIIKHGGKKISMNPLGSALGIVSALANIDKIAQKLWHDAKHPTASKQNNDEFHNRKEELIKNITEKSRTKKLDAKRDKYMDNDHNNNKKSLSRKDQVHMHETLDAIITSGGKLSNVSLHKADAVFAQKQNDRYHEGSIKGWFKDTFKTDVALKEKLGKTTSAGKFAATDRGMVALFAFAKDLQQYQNNPDNQDTKSKVFKDGKQGYSLLSDDAKSKLKQAQKQLGKENFKTQLHNILSVAGIEQEALNKVATATEDSKYLKEPFKDVKLPDRETAQRDIKSFTDTYQNKQDKRLKSQRFAKDASEVTSTNVADIRLEVLAKKREPGLAI